jgi:protein arginine kinase
MEHLARVIDQVIEHEESARGKLLDCQRTRLLDKVGKAFGLLRYSYILSCKEAFNALSGARLGVDMKLFNSLDASAVNELQIAVCSGHLQYKSGVRLSEAERDVLRAQTVRDKLKQDSA